ncbi:hypothetical protein E2C01_079436 [Portunus trituberculatus]|uniref:Uncharacterized protein n=1 Tax=Portunus trituberculatus TaxID=210409 RepID=A0A5B7IJJ8_PORTR|nr:hypothetical protein [Portunus trituberculatus]
MGVQKIPHKGGKRTERRTRVISTVSGHSLCYSSVATLLSHGIKAARKASLGNTANKIVWQLHHLHNVVRRPVSIRLHTLCQQTGVRLDDADLLVLLTLPPWRRPATTYNINWLQGKKAVVTECSTCNVTLPVEHILLHCVHYREERRPLSAYCRCRGLPLTHNTLLCDEHPDVVDRLMIYPRPI